MAQEVGLDEVGKRYVGEMGSVFRNERANKLTIPQLKEAIKMLRGKQNGANDEVKKKLDAEIESFNIAQMKLRRFARKMDESPSKTCKTYIQGKRNTMTIAKLHEEAQIERTVGLDRKYQFGAGGLMHELGKEFNMKKIALGVGVAAAGLGIAGLITTAVNGTWAVSGGVLGFTAGKATGLMSLLSGNGFFGAMGSLFAANPVALAAIIGAATILVARKVLPKIIRAVKRNNANKRAMREAQIDLDDMTEEKEEKDRKEKEAKEEADRLKGKGADGFAGLTAADFENYEANKESLIQALVDFGFKKNGEPKTPTGFSTWTRTQQRNYYKALTEAKKRVQEMDKEMDEATGKTEEDKKKAEQDKENELKHFTSGVLKPSDFGEKFHIYKTQIIKNLVDKNLNTDGKAYDPEFAAKLKGDELANYIDACTEAQQKIDQLKERQSGIDGTKETETEREAQDAFDKIVTQIRPDISEAEIKAIRDSSLYKKLNDIGRIEIERLIDENKVKETPEEDHTKDDRISELEEENERLKGENKDLEDKNAELEGKLNERLWTPDKCKEWVMDHYKKFQPNHFNVMGEKLNDEMKEKIQQAVEQLKQKEAEKGSDLSTEEKQEIVNAVFGA